MPTLKGKTLFVTGGSRGIGKAIALRAARDGAHIVIAAKTTEPHPKLPGTIYTAAEEVEKAGGRALACAGDIRSEDQIRGGRQGRGDVRRDRRSREQRERDKPYGHLANANEALRPDAPSTRAAPSPARRRACT
jgi:hypothetical protein